MIVLLYDGFAYDSLFPEFFFGEPAIGACLPTIPIKKNFYFDLSLNGQNLKETL